MTTIESTTIPPPVPPASVPPLPPPPMADEPPYSLARILLGLLLIVAAFDVCFWDVSGMGFSVAVFVTVLAAVILGNREKPWRRSTVVIGALLAGACVATAIEAGTTNTIVLVVLLLALAGDSYFDPANPSWVRWYLQLVALNFAPGRVFWLAARVLNAGFSGGTGRGMGLVRQVFLAIPALVLALVFGLLLATGNAVFGTWTGDFFNWAWKAFTNLIDFWRVVMWLFVAFLALPLLRPARLGTFWWRWMANFPRWPELVPAPGATLSSLLVLVVVNVLFGVANVADTLFLWSGSKLPDGVTYSGYVHSGVNALTVTVLLSALVLTGVFQQQLGVAGRRELKALGLVWIAQNLFVLISVVLRLKLYIEAYDMTVLRLGVIIFLMLVAAGYGLLAIKIVREKSLPWLVGGCAVAILVTFYLTQFLNLAGWSADYNVAAWEKDRSRNLDVSYLAELGAPAWPAIRKAYDFDPSDSSIHDAWNKMSTDAHWLAKSESGPAEWREFSLRAWWNRGALEGEK